MIQLRQPLLPPLLRWLHPRRSGLLLRVKLRQRHSRRSPIRVLILAFGLEFRDVGVVTRFLTIVHKSLKKVPIYLNLNIGAYIVPTRV